MTCDTADCEKVAAPSDLFECCRCNDCCRGFGGTYLSDADIAAISEFIGVSREHFVQTCCKKSGTRVVIAQADNGYCVFMKDGCSIHPVKPRMCSAWPFIPCVVKAPENWYAMASVCPGMRIGFTDTQVVECVARVIESKNTQDGDA